MEPSLESNPGLWAALAAPVLALVAAGCTALAKLISGHFTEHTRLKLVEKSLEEERDDLEEKLRATEHRLQSMKRIARRQREAKIEAKKKLLEHLERQLAKHSIPPTSSTKKT